MNQIIEASGDHDVVNNHRPKRKHPIVNSYRKKLLLSALLQEIEEHQADGTDEDLRTALTLEALEDVDAGRLIEHEDVKAWAESLSAANPLPVPLAK